jgi:HEAT repeat protein
MGGFFAFGHAQRSPSSDTRPLFGSRRDRLYTIGAPYARGGNLMPAYSPPNIDHLIAAGDINGLLRELLYQKDLTTVNKIINVFVRMNDPRIVDILIAALRDPNRDVRWNASYALIDFHDPRTVVPLLYALRDGDGLVRANAVEALTKIGDPQAVEPLIAALNDPHSHVRSKALEAMDVFHDSRAVDALVGLLTNPDARTRREAVKILGHLGDGRAIKPLLDALKSGDEEVRCDVVEALGNLKVAQAVRPLIGILNNGEERTSTKICAVIALGEIGDPRAANAIIAMIKGWDMSVKTRAIDALFALDPLADEVIIKELHKNRGLLLKRLLEYGSSNKQMEFFYRLLPQDILDVKTSIVVINRLRYAHFYHPARRLCLDDLIKKLESLTRDSETVWEPSGDDDLAGQYRTIDPGNDLSEEIAYLKAVNAEPAAPVA